jgi:hypothetical protein
MGFRHKIDRTANYCTHYQLTLQSTMNGSSVISTSTPGMRALVSVPPAQGAGVKVALMTTVAASTGLFLSSASTGKSCQDFFVNDVNDLNFAPDTGTSVATVVQIAMLA